MKETTAFAPRCLMRAVLHCKVAVACASLACGLLVASSLPASAQGEQASPQQQKEKDRGAASAAFSKALKLDGQGTAASLAGAVKKYDEAIRLWHATGNELEEARALNNLAAIHFSNGEFAQGDYAQAETFDKRSLAMLEKFLGGEHPFVVSSLTDLGSVYSSQKKYAEAETRFKKALAIAGKTIGTEYQSFLVNALEAYSRMLRQSGRDAEADKLQARVKTLQRDAP